VRYVIIGNSAAGLAAAEAIRRMDRTSSLTVISHEEGPAYSRCLSTYYLSGQIGRDRLWLNTPEYYRENNITLHDRCRIKAVHPGEKSVETEAGERIAYHKLLIASGAEPVIPGIPGIDGAGVFPLRSLAHLDGIVQCLAATREAVVLGDGLVAVTAAQALAQRGIKVTLVGIADRILAQFLDHKAAAILQGRLIQAGVNLRLQNSVKEVLLDDGGRIKEVILTGGAGVNAQLMVVAVGVKPATGFLAGSGIACDHGVLVDELLKTSVDDVYAAGDVAQARDLLRGIPAVNPLWPNAVEQGKIAGLNMTGKGKVYPGSCKMNSVNLAGVPVIAAGITLPDSNGYEEHTGDSGDNYMKLVLQNDRLAGFILLGDISKAGVLTGLMKEKTTLGDKKAKLLSGKFTYASLSGLTI